MNKVTVAMCFCMLVACDTGEPAYPSLGSVVEPSLQPAPYMPKVVDDSEDAPSDNGSDAGDSGTE